MECGSADKIERDDWFRSLIDFVNLIVLPVSVLVLLWSMEDRSEFDAIDNHILSVC